MPASDDHAAIEALFADMAAALRAGRLSALEGLFDDDMTIATPEEPSGVIIGRDAVIETYRAFLTSVRVTEYHEHPPWIRVWGDAASAGCGWVLAWEDADGAHAAYGQDVYALVRRGDGWKIVNRMLIEGDPARGQLAAWNDGAGLDRAA